MARRLYGLIWRWHFLAGVAACAVVFLIAITGALLVFADELARWRAPELLEVEPGGARRSVDAQLAAAATVCAPASLAIAAAPGDATQIWCGGAQAGTRVFVDPYRATVLGHQDDHAALLPLAQELHTSLVLGDRGRLVTEWATSWALLLMASGAYLWWPRGRRGTWWLRRGVALRLRLRDLHAVGGAYALPLLLALAATGLCWTQLAGERRWARAVNDPIANSWRAPPRSHVPTSATRIGADAALAAAGVDLTRERRDVFLVVPSVDDAPYAISAYTHHFGAPWDAASIWVDAYAGTVLRRLAWRDLSTWASISNSLYAVHCGAIAGLAGRVAMLVAALVLAALCVTGPWMWWRRRPRGQLGVPPAAREITWPALAALAALGWLLPTVGWTLCAVAIVRAIAWAARRRDTTGTHAP